MKEIRFKLNDSKFHWEAIGGNASICAAGLRAKVILPRRINELFVTFHTRAGVDTFKIGPPISQFHGAKLAEFPRTYLLINFAIRLARAYRDGYRYFRIEYNEVTT